MSTLRENVAVIIPVYKEIEALNNNELISLTQTIDILGECDIWLVAPIGLNIDNYFLRFGNKVNFKVHFFAKEYFANIAGYNKLLLNREFYQAFIEYKFILICQLDVFVFYNSLEKFIRLDYDYIGAPWFEGFGSALADTKIMGVGNGGFSLRKVSSALRILDFFDALRPSKMRVATLRHLAQDPGPLLKVLKHEAIRHVRHYPTMLPWQQVENEDIYWSMYIKGFFPWYRVATVADAIAFAFESRPELLYELNQHTLPMGAHAWQRYNLAFWKPHIEGFGYTV